MLEMKVDGFEFIEQILETENVEKWLFVSLESCTVKTLRASELGDNGTKPPRINLK